MDVKVFATRLVPAANDDGDDLVLEAESCPAFCAIQEVTRGTTEELYRMAMQEFASVGAKTWEDVCNSSASFFVQVQAAAAAAGGAALAVQVVTMYLFCFGFDAGSENASFVRLVIQRCRDFPWIAIVVRFCFFHQYHLAIRSALCILDLVEPWDSNDAYKFTNKYFTSLSMIVNVWRSVGIKTKLVAAMLEIHNAEVAVLFEVVPGRCLIGRWGACCDAEAVIIQVMDYLHDGFRHLFGDSGARRKRKKASGPGDDEAQDFQERPTNARDTAVKMSGNPFFKAMVIISYATKSPFRYFFDWARKWIRIVNLRAKAASLRGLTYVGPSFVSELVAMKAAEVSLRFPGHGPWVSGRICETGACVY
jgi:hypothetical protein